MRARRKDGVRRIPRSCEHLFDAYRCIADHPGSKKVVRASQWVQFWCKQKEAYEMPPKRSRKGDNPPQNRYNPPGVIPERPLDWTQEELDVFSCLGATDDVDMKNTYLAAFLSCWLCIFVLPDDERLIRPGTFEVASHMARGGKFSLATPVLASIYHGLNEMVCGSNPNSSGSSFPAHYLYGWLAHYFGTHHEIDGTPIGPMMVRYSGYQGARLYTDIAAHKLIHEGFSFQASSLVLWKNRCEPVCEENDLDVSTTSYIISLRTAYLPLRFKKSFFLEPYHPTRFGRQFGFCQEVPGELPRDADNGHLPYDIALKHLRLLLFVGSQTRVTLPGFALNWRDLVTNGFKQWWSKVNVSDLRENVHLLLSSVDKPTGGSNLQVKDAGVNLVARTTHKKEGGTTRKNKRTTNNLQAEDASATVATASRKRKAVTVVADKVATGNSTDGDERETNFRHHRVDEAQKDQLYLDLFDEKPDSFDKVKLTPKAVSLSSSDEHSYSSEGTSAGTRTTSSPSPHQAIEVSLGAMNAGVMAIGRHLLQELRGASHDKVEHIAAGATSIYKTIQNLGGDTADLQSIVDGYVKSVRTILAGVDNQMTPDISKVEESLQSAEASYGRTLQTSKSLQKQKALVAEKKVELEASLRATCEEEASLEEQYRQQLELASTAKSEVDSLREKLEDLRASQSKKIQSELEKCKGDLDAALS